MEREILIFFERQNSFRGVKPSQLSHVTWEMKSKEVMFPSSSSITCLQGASQSSNLRGAAGMCSPWMRSTVPAHLICHHIFHPHSLLFTRQPDANFCSYTENTASPTIPQCVYVSHLLHSFPQELEENTEYFSTSLRGCGTCPGVEFVTIPPNEIL